MVLPPNINEGLLRWFKKVEEDGAWPESFNCALIALIGKAGATHEGQLRPICLVAYVYKAWMRMRKKHTSEWTQRLYGKQVPGARGGVETPSNGGSLESWRRLYGGGLVGRKQML